MIYKELRPSTLHFPISAKQHGLQLLAVSYETRVQCLSDIHGITSFVVHIQNEKTGDEFLDWLKPETALHMTELTLASPSPDRNKLARKAYRKICDYLEANGLSVYIVHLAFRLAPADCTGAKVYARLADPPFARRRIL